MVARLLFSFVILSVFAGCAPGETLAEAGRRLGARVVQRLEPREGVQLSVRNLSSLQMGEVAEARQGLGEALAGRAGKAGAQVQVTLAENPLGYLWVAKIRRGDDSQVVMIAVEPPRAPAAPRGDTAVLDKKLIWEQDGPLLDAAPADGGVLALEPGKVSLHRSGSTQTAVAGAGPWPRDVRGRLALEGDAFRAYLPGMVCIGKILPSWEADCRPSREAWPIYSGARLAGRARIAAGRNFFEDPVEAGEKKREQPPFFSAAVVDGRWIWSGIDGRLYVNGERLTLEAGEVAGIDSPCGGRTYVLMSRRSERAEADAIQAYEIAERQPVAVGGAVEFPGPVTALWPAPGGETATAIAQDLRTGRYAAFRVSISCSP